MRLFGRSKPERLEILVVEQEERKPLEKAIEALRQDLEYQKNRATHAENQFTAARHANVKLMNALGAMEVRLAKLEAVAKKRKR